MLRTLSQHSLAEAQFSRYTRKSMANESSIKNAVNPQTVLTKTSEKLESFAEAIANATTHGFGVLLSITALVVLIYFAAVHDNVIKIVSSTIYGSALVLTYSSSTLYHSLQYPPLKKYFRIMDHSAIFLLIAGTYTPFTLVALNGAWGWSLFGVSWGLAIFGITFKLIFKHRFEFVSLTTYLLMGWMVLVAMDPLIHALSIGGLVWTALGGLAYTGGIVFYLWEKLPFSHTIWHVFVLAGSICHFFAILFYVIL